MSEYYILRFTGSGAPVGPFATREEAAAAQMERSISGTVFEKRADETLDQAEDRAMETTLAVMGSHSLQEIFADELLDYIFP